MRLRDVEIVPELRDLLPPLSADEQRELRHRIEDEGFKEPITVWLNHGVLVDGHHRHAIWQAEYDAEEADGPEIVQKKFEDIEAVKQWIILNQLSRRNLTDDIEEFRQLMTRRRHHWQTEEDRALMAHALRQIANEVDAKREEVAA